MALLLDEDERADEDVRLLDVLLEGRGVRRVAELLEQVADALAGDARVLVVVDGLDGRGHRRLVLAFQNDVDDLQRGSRSSGVLLGGLVQLRADAAVLRRASRKHAAAARQRNAAALASTHATATLMVMQRALCPSTLRSRTSSM